MGAASSVLYRAKEGESSRGEGFLNQDERGSKADTWGSGTETLSSTIRLCGDLEDDSKILKPSSTAVLPCTSPIPSDLGC